MDASLYLIFSSLATDGEMSRYVHLFVRYCKSGFFFVIFMANSTGN